MGSELDTTLWGLMRQGLLWVRPERVWRAYVNGTGGRCVVVKRLRVNIEGYVCIHLLLGKCERTVLLHRLVWMWFHGGPVPDGCEVHHVDGNKLNNDPWNLQVVTVEEHRAVHAGCGFGGAEACTDVDLIPF